MLYWNIWDGPIFSSALASLGLSLVETEQEELNDLCSGISPSIMLAQLPWLWDGPLTCLQIKNNFPQPSAFRTNVEDREVMEGGMGVLALSDTFTVALPSQWIHTFLPLMVCPFSIFNEVTVVQNLWIWYYEHAGIRAFIVIVECWIYLFLVGICKWGSVEISFSKVQDLKWWPPWLLSLTPW